MNHARDPIPDIDPNNQVYKIEKPYRFVIQGNENGQYVSNYNTDENLNNMTKSGVYHVSPNAPNAPSSVNWSFVEVLNKGTFIMQRGFLRGAGTGSSFVRFSESGTWTEWKRLSSSS